MGACESAKNNQNIQRHGTYKSNKERVTLKYFPENKNKNNGLILNNDVLVSDTGKNPLQVYQKIELLGEGAFGQVWKVRHKLTGKEFAMKIIEKNPKCNDKLLINEINILKRLDHPNILKILEFHTTQDKCYIITQYCPEGELYNEIKQGKIFTESQTAYVIYQLLSAIRYCHKMRVMHEDIKPENIMIMNRDENDFLKIKLIDFGTAKIFKEGNLQKGIVGSAYYIAPEVINGNYDEQCDVWSIGVIMYIMLTGSPPFDGRDDDSILKHVSSGKYGTSSKNYKNLSNNAKDLIAKLLEYDSSKRITARNALSHPWFKSNEFNEVYHGKNNLEINDIHSMLKNLENCKNDNIIKTAALAYLIHQNTEIIQCQNAIKLFNIIDLNHDGKIEPYELDQAFIKYYQITLNEAKIIRRKIFENIDIDNNGYIESEEFIRGCINPRLFNSENFIKYAFDYFDVEGNEYISVDQVQKKFLQSSKNNSSAAKRELKQLFQKIDSNRDGYISFEEFSQMIKNIINN